MFWSIGCKKNSLARVGRVDKRYARFGIEIPSEDWHARPFRGADLFYEHKGTGATIFLSSQCENFSDSPLVALTAQLLIGLSNVNIYDQRRIEISKREALVSQISAQIDGVKRYLKVMVLRKNRCVFDAVFSHQKFDEDLVKDFDVLIKTFWAEAAL